MGMSAEDFGAVLGELTPATHFASELERADPQDSSTRWWFSIRNHAAAHFEACEYHDWIKRGRKGPPLPAKCVWRQLKRPEVYFWILEALGLFDDPRKVYEKVLAIDTGSGRRSTLLARSNYLKELFDWRTIEDRALQEYDRLVSQSALEHRSHS